MRILHRHHTHFTDTHSPTHSSRAAPIGCTGLGPHASSLPSSKPPWPPPHFRAHVIKVSGILRGEHDIIQGVIEQLITLTQKPCPGPRNNPRAPYFRCVYHTHISQALLIPVSRTARHYHPTIPALPGFCRQHMGKWAVHSHNM